MTRAPISRPEETRLREPLRTLVLKLEGAAQSYGQAASRGDQTLAGAEMVRWNLARVALEDHLLDGAPMKRWELEASAPEAAAEDPAMRWDPALEERYLRELVPRLEPIFEQLRAVLPPGTDAGILIGVRPLEGEQWGRVIAMTTDRTRVAALAGQWVLTVLPGGAR